MIIIGKTSHFLNILVLNGTILREKMLRLLGFGMPMRMIGFMLRVFAIEAEAAFIGEKIHSLELESL